MSPKMSTRCHPKNVHEMSPKKCPRDVIQNVHEMSPKKYPRDVTQKCPRNVTQKCPRNVTPYVHEMSPFMSTRCLPPLIFISKSCLAKKMSSMISSFFGPDFFLMPLSFRILVHVEIEMTTYLPNV